MCFLYDGNFQKSNKKNKKNQLSGTNATRPRARLGIVG